MTITVPVTNTGKVAGSETVQLYIAAKDSKVARPVKELKAFQKVYLQPGETRNVTLTIGADALSYYDEATSQWRADAGKYEALIGTASDKLSTKYAFKLEK
jgi:beta-glucosidase